MKSIFFSLIFIAAVFCSIHPNVRRVIDLTEATAWVVDRNLMSFVPSEDAKDFLLPFTVAEWKSVINVVGEFKFTKDPSKLNGSPFTQLKQQQETQSCPK